MSSEKGGYFTKRIPCLKECLKENLRECHLLYCILIKRDVLIHDISGCIFVKALRINDYHLELGVLTLGVLALDGVLLENQLLRLIKEKKSIFLKKLALSA